MGIPGLKKVDHIGLTVPDVELAVELFSTHFGFELAYTFGPFASGDTWMTNHLNVNPRAEIKQIAVMNANSINLEIFEYADNIDRNKGASFSILC
ncbi:VOC family protein [Microbulbifer sp. ZKSA004]|uniref:VOC family protein n=1 Tax=Microbulbifer sp. ZKSA004 TaxID=3243389 RepID=UPI004039E2FD